MEKKPRAVADHSEPVLGSGTMVDHFKVVRLVGRGGMGDVYLARDTKLGRRVALKVINTRGIGSGHAVERFLVESRLTAPGSIILTS